MPSKLSEAAKLVIFIWEVPGWNFSRDMIVLRFIICDLPLNHWDHGFESHSSHKCLSVFLLCLCCPV
jgi:hypothetical protein